jgi:ribosomal protein S18 acetylase RimI-like enzyme
VDLMPIWHAEDVIDVASAREADIGELSRTLARAFHEDPVMTWLFPDAVARRKSLPRLFDALTCYHHLPAGGVEVARRDGVIGAAALWDPPGRWKNSPLEQFRTLPTLVRAFGRRIPVALQVGATMEREHPEEPHWYLGIIGSDPFVRGVGFGLALMRSRLDRCDAEYCPAYLESSNPDNVPYYQRFGFEVTGEITLPNGGPRLWPMWRSPR